MGPILFYTFVNDLVDGTEHRLGKPEDNTKLRDLLTYQMGVLPSLGGGGGQGGGLSRLTKHADRNLMKFKGKRKVLPQGRSNSMHQGRLEARWLESSFAENVLRVLVDEAVSPCSKQTNTILGCRRSIRLWNPNLLYEDPSISLAGVQC